MNYDVTAFFHFFLLIPLKLKKCYYNRYVSEIEPLINDYYINFTFYSESLADKLRLRQQCYSLGIATSSEQEYFLLP